MMLLLKEILLQYGWIYYYLLLLPFHLTHCQAVDSQAENLLKQINKVSESLKRLHLVNGKFCHLQSRQDQQKLLKNLLESTTSQYYLGYSYDTSYEECTSIYASGSTSSGIYPIWLKERFQFTYVYCDMDLVSTQKGWTTIQRRMNGEVNFERGWDDYVRGFGNPSSEHWLGLENIYRVSRQTRFSINILGPINIKLPKVGFDLEDWDGMKAFVQYTYFRLKSKARNYELDVNGLDEAFKNIFSMAPISGFEFSTPDRDNDENNQSHCASKYKSSWWFHYCLETHLNGPYPRYKQPMTRKNIYWGRWQLFNPNNTALRFASIKFYYSRDES